MARSDVEDTFDAGGRGDQAGRIGEVADRDLVSPVVAGYPCSFVVSDQCTHGDAPFGQGAKYPVRVCSCGSDHQDLHSDVTSSSSVSGLGSVSNRW